jgi:ankyrin repeat protein
MELFRFLQSIGVDHGYYGILAVIFAADGGHLPMVQYLIESGIQIYKNEAQVEIIRRICVKGRFDVFKYLLQHGLSMDHYGPVALVETAKGGHLEMLDYLVCELGIDVNSFGPFALRESASYGQLNVVKYLVDHGADLENYGDQAILMSVRSGSIAVLEYLLSIRVPMDYEFAKKLVLEAAAHQSVWSILYFAEIILEPNQIALVRRVIRDCAVSGDAENLAAILRYTRRDDLLMQDIAVLGALHGHLDVVTEALAYGAKKRELIRTLGNPPPGYTPLSIEQIAAIREEDL